MSCHLDQARNEGEQLFQILSIALRAQVIPCGVVKYVVVIFPGSEMIHVTEVVK
jgi:hypothetical protein